MTTHKLKRNFCLNKKSNPPPPIDLNKKIACPLYLATLVLNHYRIKKQESRIFIFPILGPQGAYKDQHIKEWKKQIKKTWHIL